MANGSRFNGLAVYEDSEDGTHAALYRDLTYTTIDGWLITVVKGFRSDFASIPRGLWFLVPPRGPYNRAAFVHDLLYLLAPEDPTTGKPCTRARADSILREACENLNCRATQRWAIYTAVRSGGWVPWNSYRRQQGKS